MATHTLNRMRSTLAIVVCMVGPCLTMSSQLQASEVQVGRYSMTSATPTVAQKDILATALTVLFPERIQTVGEAIRYLLQRSGYRLASAEAIGPDTVSLFALPLPAVHRSLGPMTLKEALEILVGPGFHLVQDPVHRLITFEQCAVDQIVHQMTGTRIEREAAQDEK